MGGRARLPGSMARSTSVPAVIAIDGPAGAGKSTVARGLAQRLGFFLLDTGAIYRSLAWAARQEGIDWRDEPRLSERAATLDIAFVEPPEPAGKDAAQRVVVGGTDVTEAI